MRLRYNITRKDVIVFQIRATLVNRIFVGMLLVVLLFFWWSAFNDERFAAFPVKARILIASFVASMFPIVTLLGVAIFSVAHALLLKESQGTLGEHTLEITEDGLVEQTAVSQILSNWRTPFKVRQSKNYGLIFINSLQAHIIPLSRPSLEGSPEEFLTEFKKRITAE